MAASKKRKLMARKASDLGNQSKGKFGASLNDPLLFMIDKHNKIHMMCVCGDNVSYIREYFYNIVAHIYSYTYNIYS